MLEDGRDQPAIGKRHGHGHVDVGVVVDAVIDVVRVNNRVFGQGEADCLGEQG
jgi:hypothetical protein